MVSFRPRPVPNPLDVLGPGGVAETQQTPGPTADSVVDCAVYLDGNRLSGALSPDAAAAKVGELTATGLSAFAWIGLHEPDAQQMQSVADLFRLHPLAVEDAVHAHQRPKAERYDNTLFLVLKTVNFVPHESVTLANEIVETGEIMIFVGPDFVVTVRHGEHTGLAEVRKRIETQPEQLRFGPPAVMHAVADHVVDTYRWVTVAMAEPVGRPAPPAARPSPAPMDPRTATTPHRPPPSQSANPTPTAP